MSSTLIIIPTYNESENIKLILDKILKLYKKYDILVVDDNSPDKTYEIVEKLSLENNCIKLLKRPKKEGLGKAYCAGFKYALKNKYLKVVQTDADLSHNPNDIELLVNTANDYDLVIGSRYISGIRIINWPLNRLILSYFANIYARMFTGMNIKDCTGGFKCFKTDIISKIDLDKINSHGYSFQIEMNYIATKNKSKIKEVPIIFTERKNGTSKMSKKIIIEAIFLVPFLIIKRFFD